MVVAGETSGDRLAADLVVELKRLFAAGATPFAPRFFGAGGPEMAKAGVELAYDMTQHSVVGLFEVLKNYAKFKRIFDALVKLACQRQPDLLICVDFSGFNLRFAQAVRRRALAAGKGFGGWQPKIVQFVSPQVWASRPGRASVMEETHDLLLTLFPFEKDWYAHRAPGLKVQFVGHPMLDRHREWDCGSQTRAPGLRLALGRTERAREGDVPPLVLILPGSREDEIRRHLPVMVDAARLIARSATVRFRIVAANPELAAQTRARLPVTPVFDIQVGGLAESLVEAEVAVASTGTVTMECALFGVPTVAMYKTSWPTYWIGRAVVNVPWLAMPNILAGHAVLPEFIQGAASGENLASAALDLLNNPSRRAVLKAELSQIIDSLGGPGATIRAARAVYDLV